METTTINSAPDKQTDRIQEALLNISRYLFLLPLGLIPVLFIPGVSSVFQYTKVFPVVVLTGVAVIFYSLAMLRSGELVIPKSLTLAAMWLVVITAILSSLFSGDLYDSLINDTLPTHSSLFLFLLATVASLLSFMGSTKDFVMKLYMLLTGSALVLGLFHIVRIVFGPSVLQFGIFTSATDSLLGGWNDAALFYGLCIILSLVVLEQLSLTKVGRILFSLVVGVSLIMLSVVNFFAVWLVLALVSLLVLMYTLVKDRVSVQPSLVGTKESNTSLTSIIISAVVFVVAMLFIVGGSFVSSMMNNATDISYVEVRPSAVATLDVAREVYADNVLFGVGPNRFADAWRLYKDPTINTTLFWNTDFVAGYSYLFTQMATNGALNTLAWLLFLGLFAFNGFRTLSSSSGDRVFHFIHVSSFVAALYLWGMAFVYNPGTAMLLLTAVFTGVAVMSSVAISKKKVVALSVFKNKASTMMLIGLVMLLIVGSAILLYASARHYSAVYTYANALAQESTATDIETLEAAVANAINLSDSDTYIGRVAMYQLLKMNSLVSLEEPTAEQQQQFEQATAQGIQNAQLAIARDESNPIHWIMLARMYSVLAAVGVENASTLATEAFSEAYKRAPYNPSYRLAEAQFLAQTGDTEGARTKIDEALALKSNYTDALLFLAQLEIAAGNTDAAITAAESMVALEPQNSARLYQLGVLQLSAGDNEAAITTFERAIKLSKDFSNARYFLAVAYLEEGESEAAIEQLEKVLELNPDNEQVTQLLQQARSGNFTSVDSSNDPLTDSVETEEPDTVVTTDTEPDTDLVVPVNTVPAEEDTTTE